jgi:hypothetical protein
VMASALPMSRNFVVISRGTVYLGLSKLSPALNRPRGITALALFMEVK